MGQPINLKTYGEGNFPWQKIKQNKHNRNTKTREVHLMVALEKYGVMNG